MAKSQNGWTAFTNGQDPNLVPLKEIVGRVRGGHVAIIFQHLIYRFDREVEAVAEAYGQPQNDWGWASRPIRGGTATSNHASGTAIDINSDKHVLGKVGTFSRAQQAAIRQLLNDFGGVIRWGGDYQGRKDEMHWELNVPEGHPAVAALANLIVSHGGPHEVGGGSGVPAPAPVPGVFAPPFPLRAGYYFGPRHPESNVKSVSGWFQRMPNGKPGHPGLALWQQRMKDRGWTITVDGLYGDQTGDVAEKFQKQIGARQDRLIGTTTFSGAWTAPVTKD